MITEIYKSWKLFKRTNMKDWPPSPSLNILQMEVLMTILHVHKCFKLNTEGGRRRVKNEVNMKNYRSPFNVGGLTIGGFHWRHIKIKKQ